MSEHVRQTESAKHGQLVGRAPRLVPDDSDKALRRMTIVIWALVAACFVLAAVVWTLLLRGLP
jgi:hypothetical protein